MTRLLRFLAGPAALLDGVGIILTLGFWCPELRYKIAYQTMKFNRVRV